MRRTWTAAILLLAGLVPAPARAADCPSPKAVVTTAIGMKYCVDPAFDAAVAAQAARIRTDVRAQRAAGRLVVYASTPLSPRGGGHMDVNVEIAASVKARLEKELGAGVWVLDPGRYQMPDVGGKSPGGAEYMVVWTAVLAGDDGRGVDVDMYHFTGPADMRAYFGCGRDDVTGCLERWMVARAAGDAAFRRAVADDPARHAAFIRYYALRASSTYSSGAHDEWNIARRINARRPIGEQVAVFFDGRAASPAEMEVEVSPGYEHR